MEPIRPRAARCGRGGERAPKPPPKVLASRGTSTHYVCSATPPRTRHQAHPFRQKSHILNAPSHGSIFDSEGCEAEFCLARHHFAATKVDAARGHIQLCLHCKARVHNTCQICPSGEKTEVACSSHCFEQLLAGGLTFENGPCTTRSLSRSSGCLLSMALRP